MWELPNRIVRSKLLNTTACPTCKRPVPIPADDAPLGPFPFCSERCKLIDFGAWATGAYRVPAVEGDDDADGPDALDDGLQR